MSLTNPIALRLAVVAFLCVRCTSDGGDAASVSSHADGGLGCPRTFDLSGPDVSFENDLMPFFSVTCAFGGCHDGNTKQAGLYLGPNFRDGPANVTARNEVFASLLARSTTAPSLYRVKPGNPAQSFLMVKITGCQNQLGLECGGAVRGKPCGDRMPALSDELPSDKKSLLARWIAQGASGPTNDAGSDYGRDAGADATR